MVGVGAHLAFASLSEGARKAWAKHDYSTEEWLPLWRHMADSAAVAGLLWDEWLPWNVRESVGATLPEGQEDGRRLIVFLAASHDLGKCTPTFACQVEGLARRMCDAGLEMHSRKQYGLDRRKAPHGLAGQMLIQKWLADRYGFSARTAGQFAVVAGGHHGTPPEHQQIHELQNRENLLWHSGASKELWQKAQRELVEGCAQLAGAGERLGEWRSVRLPQPVQVVLTAVVILSDWIASASELFPYDPSSWLSVGEEGERRRLEAAWRGLDLPGPWRPREPEGSAAEVFGGRFALPAGAEIRPVQAEAVRMAREMPAAGLLMIEAPMGEGKTEAALAAAEILAARSGAGGLLVALPTRATGDAMFPRLLAWLERLSFDGPKSVVLAHAKAALNDVWAGLMREDRQTIAAVEVDGDEEIRVERTSRQAPSGLHAHQWLRGRKKSLLASFAVGTIDQVLFAGLKSRHLALRHLAVAGKVVVIDEVHAYDAYMSRYLERVLQWLSAYKVPVVMLSATLPAERRRALAEAYAGDSAAELDMTEDAYPLITAVADGSSPLLACPPAASGRRTEVVLERLDDDLTLLVDRLGRELADGGCALVVRNTVDRVLEAADRLRERFGDRAVTVVHSRFVAADRAARDAMLRTVFGPDGDRPVGPHVVVASQVVEQSLDVDFDLLVSDLAPVDLLLQRMGRLHRHKRIRPSRLARARCLITGVEWGTSPPDSVQGSTKVYGRHALLRALGVLAPHLDGAPLVLPDHISPLVQRAYGGESVGEEAWAKAMAEARAEHERSVAEKREEAGAFLLGPVRRPGRPLFGWLEAQAGDVDDSHVGRAQVRDSEESLEVLVVQRSRDGRLTTLPWLDGGRGGLELPEHSAPSRRAAEAVAASAVVLPPRFSKPWAIDTTIRELERTLIPAWQSKECPWLAGELLLVLDEKCRTRLAGCELHYSEADGLRVTLPGESAINAEMGQEPESEEADLEGGNFTQDIISGNMGHSLVSSDSRTGVFDLTDQPWLPVQRLDGGTDELSLTEVFRQAGDLRRLIGDVPTQEFALLRLLLAILHDALDGPWELGDWADLWNAEDPFAAVPGYLQEHRDRFDLLHAERPFYQVAGLHSAKNEVSSLNRIVADVPNGEPFFAMRRPGVERLGFAEAARWIVHVHAFDPSGIKTGMEGDERVKGGKVYPLGVGSSGALGGVLAEGRTLRETLLLNLIALEEEIVETDGRSDVPIWRRPPTGPGPAADDPGIRRPSGVRDLYTWQSRRVLLHHDGRAATGVVLGYGDPLSMKAPWKLEPMTPWRRSPTQEKKLSRSPVYLPRQHDPARSAWRGLGSLLAPQRTSSDDTGRHAPHSLPPGIVRWLTMLTTEGELDPRDPLRIRTIGAIYGTQQSVIDEIVDDSVLMSVVLLHEERPDYGAKALDAVRDAEEAVRALGRLAGDLARAAGSDPESAEEAAKDRGFGALDEHYRRWLSGLAAHVAPGQAGVQWRDTVRSVIARLGWELLDGASPAASEGRLVKGERGERWIDDSLAQLWFFARLDKVLPKADR